VKVECKSPLQKVRGFPGRKDKAKREPLPSRRHSTDVGAAQFKKPHYVLPRDTGREPYEGIICGGGPGSVAIADCMDLANEIRAAKELELPYLGGNGECQLFVFPTTIHTEGLRDGRILPETTHVVYSMEEDLELCADATKTIVGWISNYHGLVETHFFFGRACGAFGQGAGDGCYPA